MLLHIIMMKKRLSTFLLLTACVASAALVYLFTTIPVRAESPHPLLISNSKAWKPFSYVDSSGEPKGILIDLWREYSEITGTPVEFLLTDWQPSITHVVNDDAQVHAGLLWSAERDAYLEYGQFTLVDLETQLFFSNRIAGTNIDYFMANGGAIGVVEGGYEQSYASQHFPDAELVLYRNNEKLVNAAFRGRVDAFIADLQVANFYLYTSANPTAFIPVKHLYSGKIRYAVNEQNQQLLTQLDAGFSALDNARHQQLLNKWRHVEVVYPKYLLPIAVAFMLSLASLYIFQLRRTVSYRTAALENANKELLSMSQTDAMTGIYNRSYFMTRLAELKCAEFGLILFDIDDFKAVNDSYGHVAGDKVILHVTTAVQLALADKHVFSRIGGEEFAILCEQTDSAEWQRLADRICQEVNKARVSIGTSELSVSVSVGAVFYQGIEKNTQVTLHDVDHLMYDAKKAGKNCVCYARLSDVNSY
ncbi:transporter substrate-binding domain-containing diguanylate cyclase [Thaumasiovibrio subtropicus]|uniref:transporter substrate-binding domain-containing diguanylate cyclase n=1 Tax=Thaumasiovibrio subtropicus TaxID=1891207 RepID=UPI000B362A09|nr:sensor domain-containing diguanylate cyclase [Thaumasiovibrio subtropicus]